MNNADHNPAESTETPLILRALPIVSSEIGAIAKTQLNEQQKYRFRGIDDVLNAIHGPLARNGVSLSIDITDLKREERTTRSGSTVICSTLKMTVTLRAVDGSSVSTSAYGEAMDTGDKSLSKAMSTAFKYAMIFALAIPVEIQDADSETHEVGPQLADDRQTVEAQKRRFNEFVLPLVRNKLISRDAVEDVLRINNYDYERSLKEIEETVSQRHPAGARH